MNLHLRKNLLTYTTTLILSLLLLTWPLAWRYTSVGIDLETPHGDTVDCTFYRVRWPGDGSIMIGRIDRSRAVGKKALEPFDLGGVFLRPGRSFPSDNVWQRLGFRWVDHDHTRDGGWSPFTPGDMRAKLIGFPHGLVILAWAGFVVWHVRRARKSD
jgi:hypothetical protein